MLYGKWVHGTEDYSEAKKVRQDVFIKEMGDSEAEEFDDFDSGAWHALVLNDDTPVATGRVFMNDGKFYIGNVAVLPEFRGMQLGDLIVRMLLDRALFAGAPEVSVLSSEEAGGLFEKFGFSNKTEAKSKANGRKMFAMSAGAEDIVFPGGCSSCSGGCEGCSGCESEEAE